MKIIEFNKIKEREIINHIRMGSIFIYPTDTIYGLGCNALNEDSVKKIREIKGSEKPFSIIAHDKYWIYKNFDVKKQYVQKLPGPFTFILKQKKRIVPYDVNLGLDTLGVRIPNHPFIQLIQKAGVPFISTSVNKTGKEPITKIKKVPRTIQKSVDIAIDAGELEENPSIIIDLTNKIARIIRV
ncbi:threonylcarbamoyl-AMP synthase [Candidatus Woesearchaeota archaeon]|nr:threonylcarbamoyl-AMP synthase [Candidatus Woesearchaeota archaeon]